MVQQQEQYFPIKVVLPREDFQISDEPGGGSRKIFGPVTPDVRQRLSGQISAIEQTYERQFAERPSVPAVAKVKLKTDALAKSHRPSRVFSEQTCPIIAVGTFRELFVRVTPAGLRSLRLRILRDASHEGAANISTIDEVMPLRRNDKLAVEDGLAGLREGLRRDGRIKVQLFDHHDEAINGEVLTDFETHLSRLSCELVRSVRYTPSLELHQITGPDESLESVLDHPGVRRAAPIPRFYAVRHAAVPVSDPGSLRLPVPGSDQRYPIVGVIDSGIADACGPLQAWIHARETFVAPAEQNREHGTFVAGLVVLGNDVNAAGVVDTGGPCHILDVVVIPNHDLARGPIGTLTEDQLVTVLRDVVPRYRDRVKVWNLSLGSEEICHDGAFTDFGQVLDTLQYENGVQFVVAAGNLDTPPLRTWPPQPHMGERDRICAPADSVVSITVGALANARSVASVVDVDEPAPFSRRGPGPAYIVKPEVVHYGGNCDQSFGYLTTGVRSLDEAARVAEDVGTSFATPIVAGTLANVLNSLDPPPSLTLAKALLIHASRYPRDDADRPINYYGFGRPGPFMRVVEASRSSATMVFEDEVYPGNHFVVDPFPYPACLIRDGKSLGHIRMTLVYNPPLDADFGLEYCRANLSASLGTWGPKVDRQTGELFYVRQVPPDPSLSGGAYEEDLVRFGFKWCPVKSYKRDFKRGVNATQWRLLVELLHRHDQAPAPQPFALIVTISGDDDLPVYDDLVAALRTYQTQDLMLRTEVRQRLRSRLN